MDFEIRDSLDSVDADAIVIGITEGVEAAAHDHSRFASIVQSLFTSGDLPLKPLDTLLVPGTPKIIFIGIARAGDAEAWRRAAATVVRRVKKVRRLAFSTGDA